MSFPLPDFNLEIGEADGTVVEPDAVAEKRVLPVPVAVDGPSAARDRSSGTLLVLAASDGLVEEAETSPAGAMIILLEVFLPDHAMTTPQHARFPQPALQKRGN
jgi:hypothetical protein